jgi:hypothetical protein
VTDYSSLIRTELQQRLAAAEDVCLMAGWTAGTDWASDRSCATTELWMRWARLPGVSTDPQDHPELVGAEASLAAQRRATRDAARSKISKIFGVSA